MSIDIWLERVQPCVVHEQNTTHNLWRMAEEAGVYQALWHPAELGITLAGELVVRLAAAVSAMRADPERFRRYDAPNGWGTYDTFLPWLQRLLRACQEWPDATIKVSI